MNASSTIFIIIHEGIILEGLATMSAPEASRGQKCFIMQILFCVFVVCITWRLTLHTSTGDHTGLHKIAKRLTKRLPKTNPNSNFKEPDKIVHINSGTYSRDLDIPKVKVNAVNCEALFSGKENGKICRRMDSPQWHLPDEHFVNATMDCASFVQSRRYIMKPISAEEATFPLAFSLIVYKNVHQVEQLLRSIYRPQNHYCIHVDGNAKHGVYLGLSKIASCFPNVIMSSRNFAVRWGDFTVLEAEFTCMQDLWNKTDWKYFINLTGQEFPLKTILDIVRILKVYNGSNAIGFDHKVSQKFSQRVQYHYARPQFPSKGQPKAPPPHNIKIVFGPVHVALTRSFVGFVLHHKVAQDFKEWLRDTNIPDETFFSSLHINPELGVPGAFTGDPKTPVHFHETFIRYKKWYKCRPFSLKVRNVCILGVSDLVDLYKTPGMFANKFFSEHQPVGRMCLEELIFNRTRAQVNGGSHLNLKLYRGQLFIKQHSPS